MKSYQHTSKHDLDYLKGNYSLSMNPFKKAASSEKPKPSSDQPASVDQTASRLHCPPPGEFPLSELPPGIQAVVAFLSNKSPLTISLIATAALSVVSACLGSKFSTKLSFRSDPTLCNLFVLLGSPTASGKGVLGKLIRIILKVQAELQDAHDGKQHRLRLKKDLAKGRYKFLRNEIVRLEIEGSCSLELERKAEEAHAEIVRIEKEIKRNHVICMGHPTGAALRETLQYGDRSVFLFSLDGGSILEDVFTGRDRTLRRFLLSGFSGEQTASETGTCGSFRGEPCLSFLFAVQPHILYSLLFNERAAQAGLLNRPIVIDSEHLTSETSSPPAEDLSESCQRWECLVRALLKFRVEQKDPLEVRWSSDAERIFKAFDQETEKILSSWPDEASQHSGRSMEMAVRLAGVLLAVESIFGGKDPHTEIVQTKTATQAVSIIRWLFRHRLRIQVDAHFRHLAALADDLENKLKRNGGGLRISRIKDSHPQIHRELNAILEAFPERFHKGEERKGKTGPIAETVVLKK